MLPTAGESPIQLQPVIHINDDFHLYLVWEMRERDKNKKIRGKREEKKQGWRRSEEGREAREERKGGLEQPSHLPLPNPSWAVK